MSSEERDTNLSVKISSVKSDKISGKWRKL